MKSRLAILVAAAITPLCLLLGCSPEAQQAAPGLIVGAMAKMSGAKRGFFITDGQPTYHDWNAGHGNIVKPLANADPVSFFIFEQPKGARHVFAKDKSHVYMASIEIEGADAPTFELITPDGIYTKDSRHVYFRGAPILDAEPATFETLVFPFSQDERHAFIGAAPIPNVDRSTWRPLRKGRTGNYWYHSSREHYVVEQESVAVFGWSRDASKIYYGRRPLKSVDVATFEVLSDYYAKDKNQVYYPSFDDEDFVLKGADPATFVVHEGVDDILDSPRPEAHDGNREYQYGKVYVSR